MNVYCVYTPKDPDSKKGLEKLLVSAKKYGVEVIPYECVWWRDLNFQLMLLELNAKYEGVVGRKTDFIKRTAPIPRIANGTTHYKLYQRCVQLNKPIMILEHDAYFVSDPDDIELPDNIDDAIIQVSSHQPEQIDHRNFDQSGRSKKMRLYGETQKPYRDWSEEKGIIPHPLSGTNGTSGYIIGPRAAQKMIDYIKSEGVAFADRIREDHIGGPHNLYLAVPQFVQCRNDIQSTRLTGTNYDYIT